MNHPDDCYCAWCAAVILDSVDPVLDPEVFCIITEARVDASPTPTQPLPPPP